MLHKHLQVKTFPKAKKENIVLWNDYRISVLGTRLFRVEKSKDLRFRDDATQSVWFRDMPVQKYQTEEKDGVLYITTDACKLKLAKNRDDCQICIGDGAWQEISNAGNLLGTYRTLDECNGEICRTRTPNGRVLKKVQLGTGVCSKTGVAVYDDASSLTLGDDGEIKPLRGDGLDEYIFAYGNDYRGAVQALYALTGATPLVPRFALGNWWSRYHDYTQEEYMQLLTRFLENEVPLSVATIDMDWHWSTTVEEKFRLKETGRDTAYYVGDDEYNRAGWTGYAWNTDLFPDYRAMLKEIKDMGLKITLNLHPADGVRFWDTQYAEMASVMGVDATTEQAIPFDIVDTKFVNAYFDILHKPFERDGVAFWWIDWQQGTKTKMDGLDPLWSLNHYHYLDNGKESETPLILSRYAGVGSHRYPLGFSGDTDISWETLDYLPYFTATASNVGYSWWSHDIGGHQIGEKNDEMFARHVQFGVLSPINRLHCSSWQTLSKEPWYFLNGAGEIVKEWLRLRHKLLPYLYSASYRTHESGIALIEPLYYEWDLPKAYEYDREYLFGGQMLVVPVTTARRADGYAYTKAWIPEGVWTDMFTGDRYIVPKGGVEKTLLRTLDSIPVLVRAGAIVPLGANAGNDVKNPKKLDICVWEGDGEFTLCEDGREDGTRGLLRTQMTTSYKKTDDKSVQTLRMQFTGDSSVVPADRVLRVSFKDIPVGARVRVVADGVELPVKNLHLMHAAAEFTFNGAKEIVVTAEYESQTELSRLLAQAAKVLTMGEYSNRLKIELWVRLEKVKTVEQYAAEVATCGMAEVIKARLVETL